MNVVGNKIDTTKVNTALRATVDAMVNGKCNDVVMMLAMSNVVIILKEELNEECIE